MKGVLFMSVQRNRRVRLSAFAGLTLLTNVLSCATTDTQRAGNGGSLAVKEPDSGKQETGVEPSRGGSSGAVATGGRMSSAQGGSVGSVAGSGGRPSRDGAAEPTCALDSNGRCSGGPSCCAVTSYPYDPVAKCTRPYAGDLGCYVDRAGLPCVVNAGIGCQYRRAADGGIEVLQTGSMYEGNLGATQVLSGLGFESCDTPLSGEVTRAFPCD